MILPADTLEFPIPLLQAVTLGILGHYIFKHCVQERMLFRICFFITVTVITITIIRTIDSPSFSMVKVFLLLLCDCFSYPCCCYYCCHFYFETGCPCWQTLDGKPDLVGCILIISVHGFVVHMS